MTHAGPSPAVAPRAVDVGGLEWQRDRTLVALLVALWWVAIAFAEWQRIGTEPLEPRTVVRLLALLVAGPLAIRYLFLGEPNKLVSIIILSLVLGGSTLGGAKTLGLTSRWLVLGLAAALGTDMLLRGRQRFRSVPHVVFLLWPVLALLSSTWAVRRPDFALEKSLSVFLLYGATMLYAYGRFSTPRRLESATRTLGKLTAVFIAANVAFLLSGLAYGGGRFRGITENPNTLGGFFTVGMAPVLFLLFGSLREHGGLRRSGTLLYLGLVLCSLVMLVASGSRAGLLGAFLGSCIYLLLAERRRFNLLMLALIPSVAILLLLMPARQLEQTVVDQDVSSIAYRMSATTYQHLLSTTASGRFEAWEVAWDYTLQRPMLGQGWGVTRFLFAEYIAIFGFREHTGAHVHNSYLELAMELGLPYAALFCLTLLLVIWAALRWAWPQRHPVDRAVAGTLLGAAIGGLAGAFWESWLIAAGSFGAFQFWFVIALLVRMPRREPEARTTPWTATPSSTPTRSAS